MENDNIGGIEFEAIPKVQLPKKMSYFNVKEAYYALFSELEENCGELTDDLDARIKELDIKLEDKMHSIFFIKKEKENDILMLKDEITRLGTKVKSIDTVIKKVKEIGLDAVLEFGANGKSGNKTLKYPDLSIWTVNRESLVVPEDLSEAMKYGRDLLLEGEEELALQDGCMFEYTLKLEHLCVDCVKAIRGAIETVHTMTDEDILVNIKTDIIKERIRDNKLLSEELTIDEQRPLSNVFEYQLVTKPSVTFK